MRNLCVCVHACICGWRMEWLCTLETNTDCPALNKQVDGKKLNKEGKNKGVDGGCVQAHK